MSFVLPLGVLSMCAFLEGVCNQFLTNRTSAIVFCPAVGLCVLGMCAVLEGGVNLFLDNWPLANFFVLFVGDACCTCMLLLDVT